MRRGRHFSFFFRVFLLFSSFSPSSPDLSIMARMKKLLYIEKDFRKSLLRTVPPFVTAHIYCASRNASITLSARAKVTCSLTMTPLSEWLKCKNWFFATKSCLCAFVKAGTGEKQHIYTNKPVKMIHNYKAFANGSKLHWKRFYTADGVM